MESNSNHNPFVHRQVTGAYLQTPQPFFYQQVTGVQSTSAAPFPHPRLVGANPFRQSMLPPQLTSVTIPNVGATDTSMGSFNPIHQLDTSLQSQQTATQEYWPFGQPPGPQQPMLSAAAPRQPLDLPPRPGSAPLTIPHTTKSPFASLPTQQVKSHQTGSRNPFGVPVTPLPSVAKLPTLLELSTGSGKVNMQSAQPTIPRQQPSGSLGLQESGSPGPESSLSNVASSFAFPKKHDQTLLTVCGSSISENSEVLSPQTTGASATIMKAMSNASMPAVNTHLKPQVTGFSGLKPFKPTSSFGAALLESLPPVSQSAATMSNVEAVRASVLTPTSTSSLPTKPPTSLSNASDFPENGMISHPGSQFTGSVSPFPGNNGGFITDVSLRPQATGSRSVMNPFRATMFGAPPVTTNPNVNN